MFIESRIQIFDCKVFILMLVLELIALMKFSVLEIAGFVK